MSVEPEAISILLCCVDGEPASSDVELVRTCVEKLQERQADWTVGPPEFVNEETGGDWTLGLFLRLPAAGGDGTVERSALGDVEALVDAAKLVTADTDTELVFELDGEVVGWVGAGEADRMLMAGLLQPWRQRLAQDLS